MYFTDIRSIASQIPSSSRRSTTRPRSHACRYGFLASSTDMATRGSCSMFFSLRVPFCVKKTMRSSSKRIQMGTLCGPPSGSTVAMWAKFGPSRMRRTSSSTNGRRCGP
jgi:hypothetical protein